MVQEGLTRVIDPRSALEAPVNLPSAANDYGGATERVPGRAATVVTDENIDRHVRAGWSARQVVHHVADSETQSYARLRRLLAEPPGSLIQGYDEAAWARVRGARLPGTGDRALARRRSSPCASASLDVLRRLSAADLERYGAHSESGATRLATWLEIYTRHPREHARPADRGDRRLSARGSRALRDRHVVALVGAPM